MGDEPQRKPRFWPVVFVTAFLLGAILWGLWMSKIIQQTRMNRIYRTGTTSGTNVPILTGPSASTNGARTNAPGGMTNGVGK